MPRMKGKIPSGKDRINLELKSTPKIIGKFRELNPETFLVGFKAESIGEEAELIRRAFDRMNEIKMDLVVANDLSNVTESTNTIMTITPSKEVFKAEGRKEDLSRFIMDKTWEQYRSKRGSS